MDDEIYNMVEECTNEYKVTRISESETVIYIRVPKKFEELWLVKLSDLETTMKEIKEFSDGDAPKKN